MIAMPPLEAQGHRPLKMTFEDQLKALIFFHLEEHTSAQHLLQVLEEDGFARDVIAPEKGIKKSSFGEAINSRGLEQLVHIYQNLQSEALDVLPKDHDELGDLIGIDGSLIDACLSMHWADYRKGAKEINPDSNIFYDAIVLLGTPGVNQTKKPLRLVGYTVDGPRYWVATTRYDLTAEQIALIYKLRWDIEKFFAWWKRHLKVYHLIARSEYGLMVQILAGLITYLLLAIYCREQHNEKVSIKRVGGFASR